jgi:hypothetical protein
MRSIATADDPYEDEDAPPPEQLTYGPMVVTPPPEMLSSPTALRGPASELDVARSLNPDTDLTFRRPRMPVSRVWLLAALLGMGASATGLWFLAGPDEAGTWEAKRLWAMIADPGNPRRLWHVITGGTVFALPLLLAIVMRVSRKPKFMLGVLGLLFVMAVALQVWLGVLLMLDTPQGSILRFNGTGGPSTSPTTEPADPFEKSPSEETPANAAPAEAAPAETGAGADAPAEPAPDEKAEEKAEPAGAK